MDFENNTSINEVLRRIKTALRERELRASAMAAEGEVSIAPPRRAEDPRIRVPGQKEFADDVFMLSKSMEVDGGAKPVPTVGAAHAPGNMPSFAGVDWDDFYRLLSRRVAAFLRASNSALMLEDWLRENLGSIIAEAKG